MTNVINIKHQKTWRQDGVEYIGRGSIFGNPYMIGKDGTRDIVIKKYTEWFYEKIQELSFHKSVLNLKDKTLGCYCRPSDGFQGQLLCHGQIIAAYLDDIEPEDVA